MGEQVYDVETHQQLVAEIKEFKEQKDRKTDEKGKISARLEELQKKLENQMILLKEHEQLEVRAENIRIMKSLFTASGFVIISHGLFTEPSAANKRFFQLTRQRLSLGHAR